MISTGAERADVEHIYEGVGRGAQVSDAGQYRVHRYSRHGCHNNCHRGSGAVTPDAPAVDDRIVSFVCRVWSALVPALGSLDERLC